MTRTPARPARLRLAATGGALALGLVLTGCGADDPDTTGTAAAAPTAASSSEAMEHGSTAETLTGAELDKAFVAGMIPHHKAAVEMAQVELAKGTDPQVKALAQKIVDAQQAEIATLEGVGSSIGADTTMGHSGPMGEIMGMPLSMDMSAMATELEAAKDVDMMFLTMMIPHHASAISMADEERNNGANADLKTLAQTIVADQAKEIGEMQGLLAAM